MEVPEYLVSTYRLISKTFKDKISEDEYQGLIMLLYQNTSDRNLAKALSFFVEKDEIEILNDIGKYYNENPNRHIELKKKLVENGYNEWLLEE